MHVKETSAFKYLRHTRYVRVLGIHVHIRRTRSPQLMLLILYTIVSYQVRRLAFKYWCFINMLNNLRASRHVDGVRELHL